MRVLLLTSRKRNCPCLLAQDGSRAPRAFCVSFLLLSRDAKPSRCSQRLLAPSSSYCFKEHHIFKQDLDSSPCQPKTKLISVSIQNWALKSKQALTLQLAEWVFFFFLRWAFPLIYFFKRNKGTLPRFPMGLSSSSLRWPRENPRVRGEKTSAN